MSTDIADILVSLAVPAIIILLLVIRSRRQPTVALISGDRDGNEVPTPAATSLPFPASFAWRWFRLFRSRSGVEGEVLIDTESQHEHVVTFPVARTVMEIVFIIAAPRPPIIDLLQCRHEDETVEVGCALTWRRRGGSYALRMRIADRVLLTTIRLSLADPVENIYVDVIFLDRDERDARLLKAVLEARRAGFASSCQDHLEEYDADYPDNPVVVLSLAEIYRENGTNDLVEDCALRACALQRSHIGVGIYRDLRMQKPWHLEPGQLTVLKKDAEDWKVDRQRGLIALQARTSFRVGRNGYERKRYHLVMLVRRRAAARKLRHLSVPMVTVNGGLLFTAARVVRADGSVVELADDAFTVGSAHDDNPFIAVDRKQAGTWILPDLAVGDVVEYTYDTARLGRGRGHGQDYFMLANLTEPWVPTYRGEVMFTAAASWNLAFATRNTDAEPKRVTSLDDRWAVTSYVQLRTMPRVNRGDPFQANVLNPLVTCAVDEGEWADVCHSMFEEVQATVAAVPELPAALAEAVGVDDDPRAALARAFYWVRDHIKYGALQSALTIISNPDRAQRLVDTGVGDCKDVSFLLAVVCRFLEIPCEFVLVSTEHGLILEDLPADQFDHIMVRARVDDEWLYLDASSAGNVFGNTPIPCQGMRGLAGADPATLVTLPTDLPNRNRLEIHETLTTLADGWLHTRVAIRIHGHMARWMDEAWKQESLGERDSIHAATELVRRILPDYKTATFERLGDTGNSDDLTLEVTGRRAKHVVLGDGRICSFGIIIPAVSGYPPDEDEIRERCVFPFLQSIEYLLDAEPAVAGCLQDVSRAQDWRCEFCEVAEEKGAPGTGRVLRRTLTTTRREIVGEDIADLPAYVENVEEICRIVLALSGDGTTTN